MSMELWATIGIQVLGIAFSYGFQLATLREHSRRIAVLEEQVTSLSSRVGYLEGKGGMHGD